MSGFTFNLLALWMATQLCSPPSVSSSVSLYMTFSVVVTVTAVCCCCSTSVEARRTQRRSWSSLSYLTLHGCRFTQMILFPGGRMVVGHQKKELRAGGRPACSSIEIKLLRPSCLSVVSVNDDGGGMKGQNIVGGIFAGPL